MYSTIAKKILAPTLDLLRGTKTMEYLKELEETQWWPRDRILDLQNDRLRKLIRHVYETVPYYNQIFRERRLTPEDIKTQDDLIKLPILKRDDIRHNFDNLVCRGFSKRGMIFQTTGGSTGEPLRFYKSKEDMYSYGGAAELRAYHWAGYNVGDKCALIGGAPFGLRHWPSFLGRVNDFFKRCMAFHSRDMSKRSMETFARKLESFRPVMIKGYASALYVFASFVKQNGIAIQPKCVVSSAEKLFDYQRQTIEEAFGCKVYDFYGSHEVPTIAHECSKHSGYHIAAENVIVEVTDDSGKSLKHGEIGKILLTNLHNYIMPFIRYEIGDLGILSEEMCSCGRSLPLMRSIEGRSGEVLFGSEGRIIMPVLIPYLFYPSCRRSPSGNEQFQKIKQFQVVQEKEGKIIVKIVKAPNSSEEEFAYILTNFREHFGSDIKIDMKFVDSIPPLPSGKRSYIVSRVPSQGVCKIACN